MFKFAGWHGVLSFQSIWVMRQAKRKHYDYQVIKGLAPLYSFVTDGKLQMRSPGEYVVAVCKTTLSES